MKKQNSQIRTNFFKKIFIKICRICGYEIIDQSNFYVPTQEKELNENLSIQGEKSITLPLGETRISRKVNGLTVIFRSCTSVNMLTQNKKRLFNENKSEYTFRSLNSIIKSLNRAKSVLPKIKFDIIIDRTPHTIKSMYSIIQLYSSLLTNKGILIIEDIKNPYQLNKIKKLIPQTLEHYTEIYQIPTNELEIEPKHIIVINKNKTYKSKFIRDFIKKYSISLGNLRFKIIKKPLGFIRTIESFNKVENDRDSISEDLHKKLTDQFSKVDLEIKNII